MGSMGLWPVRYNADLPTKSDQYVEALHQPNNIWLKAEKNRT